MKSHAITLKVTAQCNYPSSLNLPQSFTPSRLVKTSPGQFTSSLAHEVRNPLSNINLAIEILRSTIRENERKIYMDIITRASNQINNLITDFLMPVHTDEMQLEKHSIRQLINEVLIMTEDRMLLKKITVSKDYTISDDNVLVNKQKIKIALTNIIINAIDAMPSKGGKLKLATKSINGKCIIKIEDNGTGISKENLKHIFKPYFTNKPHGMGLGLSTTLDILLSNNVKLNVQSLVGEGTCFILSFYGIQHCE